MTTSGQEAAESGIAQREAPPGPAPLLVFGWGNPSRGDDALGPLCAQRLRASRVDVECLDDFQLQAEHALDLVGRQRVLLVDASLCCRAPYETTVLRPGRDDSVTTHALSPQALLGVYRQVRGEVPPPCTLLAIRGERFELGEPPSPEALAHLDAALAWAKAWLDAPASPPPD